MDSQTVSASFWLNEVVNWDGKSPNINRVLATAFGAEDYLDCVRNLQARGIDPLSYINSLDRVCTHSVSTRWTLFLTILRQIIDSLPVGSEIQRRCLRALRKTCGLYGVLPSSYTIPYPLSKPGQRAFASGGFADVWRLTDPRDTKVVFAVKSLRVYEQDPVEKINKV